MLGKPMKDLSRTSRAVIHLAGLLLPRGQREEYRESWAADISGAEQLGISIRSVLHGVVSFSITKKLVTQTMIRSSNRPWSLWWIIAALAIVSVIPPMLMPVLIIVAAWLTAFYGQRNPLAGVGFGLLFVSLLACTLTTIAFYFSAATPMVAAGYFVCLLTYGGAVATFARLWSLRRGSFLGPWTASLALGSVVPLSIGATLALARGIELSDSGFSSPGLTTFIYSAAIAAGACGLLGILTLAVMRGKRKKRIASAC